MIIKADNRFGNRFGIWIVEALARGKQPVTVIQVRQLGVNVICLAEAQIEWTGRAAHADVSDLQVRENMLCNFQGDESRTADLGRVLLAFYRQLLNIVFHIGNRVA